MFLNCCTGIVIKMLFVQVAEPVQEAFVIVDKMYFEVPDLMKDAYWDQKSINLPVTEATAAYKKVYFPGSAAQVQ